MSLQIRVSSTGSTLPKFPVPLPSYKKEPAVFPVAFKAIIITDKSAGVILLNKVALVDVIFICLPK